MLLIFILVFFLYWLIHIFPRTIYAYLVIWFFTHFVCLQCTITFLIVGLEKLHQLGDGVKLLLFSVFGVCLITIGDPSELSSKSKLQEGESIKGITTSLKICNFFFSSVSATVHSSSEFLHLIQNFQSHDHLVLDCIRETKLGIRKLKRSKEIH